MYTTAYVSLERPRQLGGPATVRPALLLAAGAAAGDSQNGVSMARRSRLEAVLFLAREPLSLRKLAQLANLTDATEARTVLKGLRDAVRRAAVCVSGGSGGWGVSVVEPAGICDSGCVRNRHKSTKFRLSPPSLETLVVVAYRQPVLRAEVEAIRGVACGEILRQLLDRDLLRIVGRSEELGRPLRYGTTKRFLEVFGLSNLEELPWAS